MRTEQLAALGGEWSLRGIYTFDQSLLDMDIGVADLPLENLREVAKTDGVSGTLDGEWDAYIYGLRVDPNRLSVKGGGTIRNFRRDLLTAAADEVKFVTTMANGVMTIDPITMRRGNAGREPRP